jgi:hypothetical protein
MVVVITVVVIAVLALFPHPASFQMHILGQYHTVL